MVQTGQTVRSLSPDLARRRGRTHDRPSYVAGVVVVRHLSRSSAGYPYQLASVMGAAVNHRASTLTALLVAAAVPTLNATLLYLSISAVARYPELRTGWSRIPPRRH